MFGDCCDKRKKIMSYRDILNKQIADLEQRIKSTQDEKSELEKQLNKLKVTEFNCETGEEILRDATDKEMLNYKASEKAREALEAEAEAKANAKAAILDRIGLTVDELQTILG